MIIMDQHALRYIYHIIVYIVLIVLLSLSNLDFIYCVIIAFFVAGLFLAAYFYKTDGLYGLKLFLIGVLVLVIPLSLLVLCTDFSSIPSPWLGIISVFLVTVLGTLLILILKRLGFIKFVYE